MDFLPQILSPRAAPTIALSQRGVLLTRSLPNLSINPSVNYLEKAHDDIKYGNYSQNPHLDLTIPSIINPNLAPKGKHVMSATVQHIPYKLKNENWNDQNKNEVSKIITQVIEKYIPKFSVGRYIGEFSKPNVL